jgi:hypothetical protein
MFTGLDDILFDIDQATNNVKLSRKKRLLMEIYFHLEENS